MLNCQNIMLLIRLKPGYPQRILAGIRQYAIGFDHWMWLGVSPELKAIDLINKRRPDGIIGTIRTPQIAQAISRLNIPSVDVGGFLQHPPGASVGADNIKVGAAAAEYFLNKQYRHFAFVGPQNVYFSRQRHRGFADVLQTHGHAVDSLFVNAFHDFSNSQNQPVEWTGEIPKVRQWLKQLGHRNRPLAIFCSHDEYALAVLSTCRVLNLHVPDDIAVLGTDDNDLVCALANPPLSSVHYNVESIGYQAAKLLDQMLSGQVKKPQSLTVPPTAITVRGSTDRLLISDSDVATAMRLIRSHINVRLRVTDIVMATNTSRRTLEMKFKKYLGHGIHQEILRARVELAKKLMRETDLPLKAISARAGFMDRNRMLLAFRTLTGMSPGVFRDQLGRISSYTAELPEQRDSQRDAIVNVTAESTTRH
jgi:LacI family transcriptional regulator